ncbi:MAG: uncharacterized protein KVP18_001005 [Porospora cf. gigantea A]|uniref:uncharacterized protein n=1 Tax=Porospora cf. gigantea A TaxID=2853593 RepID=UPI00355A325C|nr:MAG: hypothetical protein KVP18_001005 [Porospora cf. gigantea A]
MLLHDKPFLDRLVTSAEEPYPTLRKLFMIRTVSLGLFFPKKDITDDLRALGESVVPHTVLPITFSRRSFLSLRAVTLVFQKLYDNLACDVDTLLGLVAPAAKSDPAFLGRMVDIAARVYKRRTLIDDVRLMLSRSDYIVGQNKTAQVEMNMIASGLHHLNSQLVRLHKANMADVDLHEGFPDFDAHVINTDGNLSLGNNLLLALEMYSSKAVNARPVVLLVGDGSGANLVDQVSALKPGSYIYLTPEQLKDFHADGRIADEEGSLIITYTNGRRFEIAVVYQRKGYVMDDYVDESWWEVRELIEGTDAVKVPSIPHQLAGTKQIQALLADRNLLLRYLSVYEADLVLAHTARQADPSLDTALAGVCRKVPNRFVLKPSMEGGGNNLFGEDILTMLDKLQTAAGTHWVLMERVRAATQTTAVFRKGAMEVADVENELGFFGARLMCGSAEVINEANNYLSRVKLADCDEGGLSSGNGMMSTLYLVD